MRLVLCRHASPDGVARGRLCGLPDVGLSARGRVEARALATALAALQPAAVYASPYRRAVETAEAIAGSCGLDVTPLDALRELDFGDADGLTAVELHERHPDVYDTWIASPATVRFPRGETYTDLRTRAWDAVSALVARHDDETIVAVAHGGTLRAVLAACLELDAAAAFRVDQRYASVNVVEWHDGVPFVRLVNGDGSTAL